MDRSRLWLRGKEEEVLALLVTGGTDGGGKKKLSIRDYQFYEKQRTTLNCEQMEMLHFRWGEERRRGVCEKYLKSRRDTV